MILAKNIAIDRVKLFIYIIAKTGFEKNAVIE